MIKCKLCGSKQVNITYQGIIRDGGLGKYTNNSITMYQCNDCNVIWHDEILDIQKYYETSQYRLTLEGTSDEEDFYRMHDKESFEKFRYTGTDIYRHKIVADIGCGCGAFLDLLKGVVHQVIAIEPSDIYRDIMAKKEFNTYAYTRDALVDYQNQVDVVVSFDVIEHVVNPEIFLSEIYALLSHNGKAIIGTPTEAPIMRKLLGEIYEQKLLFSTQHLWVFGEKNLLMMAQKAGFLPQKMSVKYFQRYGLGNLLGWLREKRPRSNVDENFITNTMDGSYKSELEKQGMADYIVLYLEK